MCWVVDIMRVGVLGRRKGVIDKGKDCRDEQRDEGQPTEDVDKQEPFQRTHLLPAHRQRV